MKLIVSLEARGAGSLHQLPHWFCALVLSIVLASAAVAGTFGTVVPISGHASDLALDERRGVLYVANMTASRIEVISLATKSIQTSWNVAQYPGSVSLSPSGRYLVVTHFRNFADSTTWSNVVTVIDLDANVRQTYALDANSPPLGVAFGIDNLAFIVTMKDFRLLDPATGTVQNLGPVPGVTANTLPVPAPTFPPEIIRASVGASGDGLWIYGVAEAGGEAQYLAFRYNVTAKQVEYSTWDVSPPLGPRVVSVSKDGSVWVSGWGLFRADGAVLAVFHNASGIFNVGSLAIDSTRGPYGTIYAEVATATTTTSPQTPTSSTTPAATTGPPVLQITDADNLTLRERLNLPEHLASKSALSADGMMMYSVSDSGVMFLPVGSLAQSPRVAASQEDLVFRGNFCDRGIISQDIDIVDPGGGKTDFTLSTTMNGVTFSPSSGVTPAKVLSGVTPAKVRVVVDPAAFQNYRGTVKGTIDIVSKAAVNIPPSIWVLVNNREPDQRGAVINVPGTLVDILVDAPRNLFYVLRQDKNQVLVFQASTYKQIGVFRTGNTPTSMALLHDPKLLIGNDDSQIATVIDLDRMAPTDPVVFPPGHYPRSIAVSGNAILAASRVPGQVPVGFKTIITGDNEIVQVPVMAAKDQTIDRIDMHFHVAVPLPNLGIYENKINVNTVLAGSPSGGTIFIAQADGTVMLYEASSDTFVASRKDFTALSGAYAALSDSQFVVDNNLLGKSLVPIQPPFESGTGLSSGIALADQYALRTTALSATNPGVIERVELGKSAVIRPTRMIEAPLLSDAATPGAVFRRTLAAQPERRLIYSLTTSGLTVLPWDYDAATADPRLEAVTSSADGSGTVAVGGLITIWGHDLSLTSAATSQIPLPTILGDSCLTINGVLIPMSLISPGQINAQLPYSVVGQATMVLRSPAGVSNNLTFTVQPTAAGVFRTGTVGAEKGLATVVRALNGELVTLSNPIHPEDWIVIYAAGLGGTTPTVPTGYPGPSDPLAQALIQPVVTLGDVSLPIGYAGLAPGQVGVYQINAYVPYWAPLGMEIPLRITQGGSSTTLMVRVVK